MHHFIYATKDAWISSGSSTITGESFRDQNFGQDEILELKKVFYNDSFDYATRVLVSFKGTEFTNMSQSIVDGEIVDPKFYLRLYEAEGNQELSTTYKLASFPVSQSWDEGTGQFGDDPKTTLGVSWENRNNYVGATEVTWSTDTGLPSQGGQYHSGSEYEASQSFDYQSPDINMEVTDIVNRWMDKSLDNNGFLVRFSGSQEEASGSDGSITFGQLKFFSSQTSTIYPPKLEVRWDDHTPCTGSATGSLLPASMSGEIDTILTMKHLRESYRESDKVKFRVSPRPRHVTKTFNTSVQTLTGSFIPEGSGSYSIIDVATNETIIPFSPFTPALRANSTATGSSYLSCDGTSNYFVQWMNGFHPNRIYKIIYKLKFDDNQEILYDDGFEFKLRS
jgi:hypothetical protein|tara:strand:- start:158 stop:1336 length:1179 start_codon:yes stop_codon:yes gene_type:complete